MVRFILQHRTAHPDELQAFSHEGFEFQAAWGDEDFPHFIRGLS